MLGEFVSVPNGLAGKKNCDVYVTRSKSDAFHGECDL